MKKTYYIPTTSLNFGNILSTESISPKSFYEKRGFGSSRWFSIEENKFGTITLMYEKPFRFERPISDLEDYPMFIEFSSDEHFEPFCDGIFYTDRTIYLDPWNTKFVFLSEKAKKRVLGIAESNLENKVMELYSKRMEVNSSVDNPMYFKLEYRELPENEKAIKQDIVINKLKGLLYGYYIGAFLSASGQNVQKLSALLEAKDICYSVLSNEYNAPTSAQRKRLKELFDELNKVDEKYLAFRKIWSYCQAEAIIKTVRDIFGDELLQYPPKIIDDVDGGSEKIQSVIDLLKRDINDCQNSVQKERKRLSVEDAELDVSKVEDIRIKLCSQEDQEKFKKWIQFFIHGNIDGGYLSSKKLEWATELTARTKELLGQKWEGSNDKKFLNAVRKLLGGEKVEFEWRDGLLCSLAAVLVKGESWDKLLSFVQAKKMTDYRFVFAIYGIIKGFANLTNDFTGLIIDTDTAEGRAYVDQFYSEFYRQLLHKEVDKSQRKLIKNKPALCSSIPQIKPQGENNNLITPLENLIRVAVKKNCKHKNLTSLENTLQKHRPITEENLEAFFMDLGKEKEWQTPKTGKPNKDWKELKKQFDEKPESKQTTLFPSDEPLNGKNVLSKMPSISELWKNDSCRNRLIENWEYVCKLHKDKKEIIKHFVNLSKQEGRGDVQYQTPLKGVFTEDMGKQLWSELLKCYEIR